MLRIQLLQPKAVYVHCFAHSSNLSIQDAVRSVPIVRDVMQSLRDLATVTRSSAKRMDAFKTIAQRVETYNAVTPRPFCPTRRTVRFAAIDAALKSYPVILPFLSEVASMSTADDSASKAHGLISQFENGRTLLALLMAHQVFPITDSLSCSLQSSTATVLGGLAAVNACLTQLRSMRSDERFAELWREAESKISQYDLRELALPRHIQPPKRYNYCHQQRSTAHKFESAMDYFKVQYFVFIDNVIQHIVDRFMQPGMRIYSQMESLILKACHGEDFSMDAQDVCSVFDELDQSRLECQLHMLPDLCSKHAAIRTVSDFTTFFRQKDTEVRCLFSEVHRLLQLLLVVPASSIACDGLRPT